MEINFIWWCKFVCLCVGVYRFVLFFNNFFLFLLFFQRTISVTKPDFYAKRFLDFMCKKVFGRLPSTLDTTPSSSTSLCCCFVSNQIELKFNVCFCFYLGPNYYNYKRQNSATMMNQQRTPGFRSGGHGFGYSRWY